MAQSIHSTAPPGESTPILLFSTWYFIAFISAVKDQETKNFLVTAQWSPFGQPLIHHTGFQLPASFDQNFERHNLRIGKDETLGLVMKRFIKRLDLHPKYICFFELPEHNHNSHMAMHKVTFTGKDRHCQIVLWDRNHECRPIAEVPLPPMPPLPPLPTYSDGSETLALPGFDPNQQGRRKPRKPRGPRKWTFYVHPETKVVTRTKPTPEEEKADLPPRVVRASSMEEARMLGGISEPFANVIVEIQTPDKPYTVMVQFLDERDGHFKYEASPSPWGRRPSKKETWAIEVFDFITTIQNLDLHALKIVGTTIQDSQQGRKLFRLLQGVVLCALTT